MESVARYILNNAQTSYDGGIISSILNNVNVISNDKLMEDALPFLISPKLTGGYVAGLIFGIIWLSSLCFVVVYSCCSNCNDKSMSKDYHNKIGKNRRLYYSNKFMDKFLLILTLVMLFFVIILLISLIVNFAQLQYSIKQSSKDYRVNVTKPQAIRPALKTSIYHIKNYISKFPDEARTNTAPIIDEVVAHTINMQKETQELFNRVLMNRLKVSDTVGAGKQMADVILTFFDIFDTMNNSTKTMTKINNNIMLGDDPKLGFSYIVNQITSKLDSLKNCDETCQYFKKYFEGYFKQSTLDINSDNAKTFSYLMKHSNKTRKSILDQAAESEMKLAEMKAKTNREMKKRLDVPQLIRNSSNKNWDMLDQKMPKIMKMMDSFVEKFENDEVDSKIAKLSSLMALVFVTTIIFIVIFVSLSFIKAIYPNYFCKQQFKVQYILMISIQSCFGLISLILLFTMILFLYGGKYETEFCRYIRTSQPIINTNNDEHFVLDTLLNEKLPELIENLTKNQTDLPPIPELVNIYYGLIYNCKMNQPILKAIGIVDKLDMSAMSDPKMSELIVEVGRSVMNDSLMKTDPNKMIPSDMKNDLNQAVQLKLFSKPEKIKSFNLLVKKINNKNIEVNDSELRSILTKFRSSYSLDKDLKHSMDYFTDQLDSFVKAKDSLKSNSIKLQSVPNIEKIVLKLNSSLHEMVGLMTNKPKLLKIANDLYDEMIAATTPNKTIETMKIFGPKILAVLGPCRPIYLAYESTIDTICDVTISKLNASWVYMGTCVLIMTLLWIEMMVNFYMTRLMRVEDGTISSPNSVAMNKMQLSSDDNKPDAKQPMNPNPVDV